MDESERQLDRAYLLHPRGCVTFAELELMPASLTPAEAMPWTRLSRGAFYRLLGSGDLPSCRLGHSIRIPTRRFLSTLDVLEDDDE